MGWVGWVRKKQDDGHWHLKLVESEKQVRQAEPSNQAKRVELSWGRDNESNEKRKQ